MSETIITSGSVPQGTINSNSTGTFCQYLARELSESQGFAISSAPEVVRLAGASDFVLTENRVGWPFTILCLIDRESHPERTFGLSHHELSQIAGDCLKYAHAAAPIGSPKSSVVIRVIEVGPTSDHRWEQLKALNWTAPDAACRTVALAVDTAHGEVLRDISQQDGFERTFVEGLLRLWRQHEAAHNPLVEIPAPSFPYLTFGIIAMLVSVFVGELAFAVDAPARAFEPSVKTLISLGGLQQLLAVGEGERWRLFTGPLLHANPIHLALNCFALLLAGSTMERIVGRLWFAAIFVISALAGAGGSLLFNPHSLVSVGASGGIMGLFAAMVALSFRYTHAEVRSLLQKRAFGVLIPSLLPLASAANIAKVDYAAHIVGAVAGAAVGFVLVNLWRDQEMIPGFRWIAASVIAFGLLGTAIGGTEIATARTRIVLIPPEYLPKKDSDIHEASAWWYVDKYPSDPRSHLYKAIFLTRKSDLAGAEHELRTALDQKRALETSLAPSFTLTLQGTLALVLMDERRIDEARQMALAACHDGSSDMFAKLNARGLCTKPS